MYYKNTSIWPDNKVCAFFNFSLDMIHKKTFFYILFLLFVGIASFAQQPDIYCSDTQTNLIPIAISLVCSNDLDKKIEDSTYIGVSPIIDSSFQNKPVFVYPPASKDYRKLALNTGLYLGIEAVVFGVFWISPESFSHWDKKSIQENGIAWKWKQNVRAGPVWDHDVWYVNYTMHPYVGGLYYMTARSSGFNVAESFFYSFLMSTFFWEYGIEAFAEVPSTQDLILTPILGSVIGEAFFYAKKSILKHDRKVLNSGFLGGTTLFFIDPFNTMLDGMGYKQKIKTQSSIAPVGVDQFSSKTIWGLRFSATF